MAVSIRGSFQRSINLIRDFQGNHATNGYIITAKSRELLHRIADALLAPAANRAWSITGPYGGGKSAFALFAAHLLRGDEDTFNKIRDVDASLFEKLQNALPGAFCPVLVVGSREPLGVALLRGLAHGAESFSAYLDIRSGRSGKKEESSQKALRELVREAEAALAEDVRDDTVVELYERAASIVNEISGGGLLLVVDELGKLLEYAALYPERSDLYVLQRLAERASRSSNASETASPLLVFTILHQAFERYAGRLSTSQRDEWRKVQGRFEDFAYVEPVSETLRLIARAIRVDDPAILPDDGLDVVDRLLDAATLQPSLDRSTLRQHLADALPLHPAVSMIVGPLFRRLAQNERSLFAFLASGEPGSFLDIMSLSASVTGQNSAGTTAQYLPRYRLDHLYDYLIGTVGAALFNDRLGRLWAETEAAISRFENPSEITVRVLKQIALLSFAGPLAGLHPTAEVLRITVDAPAETVDKTLALLKKEHLVTYRSFKEEYHIWQGSDFDLDAELRKAREHVPARTALAKLLTSVVPPRPIVARRHSYRTGTTRVFEVLYASDEGWHALVQTPLKHADGRIIYVLPEHDGDTVSLIGSIQDLADDPLTLIAVPDGVRALRELVYELACYQWVREHAEGLQGDEVARREVDQQLADLSSYVEQRLSFLLVADADGRNPCTWIYQGNTFRLQNERALQEQLSQISDRVFCHTPEIWNELLNRRKPSSNAIKGLKLLLSAMIEKGDVYRLGIQKYPAEYGMYASILQATRMHRPFDAEGKQWHFAPPDPTKNPGCVMVWNAIEEQLETAEGGRVSIKQIYELLSKPPYGVREGLIPIFLLAVYKSAEDEIALYESGTFVSQLDFQTIERLLKSPDKFELQWVEIKGARKEVLHYLAPLVGLPDSVDKPLPFVLRLLGRVHGLPPFVRKTASLSPVALNVREALHHAVEPTTLLFHDLPKACGISTLLTDKKTKSADVQTYTRQLQEALRELGGAYEGLLTQIQEHLARVFHLHAITPDDRRHELAERAKPLLAYATDTKLKAFLVRATDEILDTQGWYESLAALLVKRPPLQWSDDDLSSFGPALREVARRFHTLEALAFDAEQVSPEPEEASAAGTRTLKRVRLSVTVQYEDEHEHVISIHPEDSDLIEQIYQRLHDSISGQDVTLETKIAALAKLSNELLIEREQTYESNE